MEVNVQEINGDWDLGYSLDKHVLSSVFLGEDQWGHARFNTTRSDIGEALYQLKYKTDFDQVETIAQQLFISLSQKFSTTCLVIPMPPSKARARQPVVELANKLAEKLGVPCFENLLVKAKNTPQMKDIDGRAEKIEALMNAFQINDQLGEGQFDILIVDDLFDTGSSLEAATKMLRSYGKIRNVFVATATRKN